MIEEIEKKSNEMCMDAAPMAIAACVPPNLDKDGIPFKNPWCHLPKGHDGPHKCGQYRWR